MPRNHSRANAVKALQEQLAPDIRLKRADALKLLDHEECELLVEIMEEYCDVGTYAAAVHVRETSPRYQLLCGECGWTLSMICPECPGCGCYTGKCSGWRHHEFDEPDEDDYNGGGCPECGAGGCSDPYGECVCYDYDDEEDAA